MKQIISNYSLDTSSKTVALTDFSTIRLDRLELIVDVTTNKILYNFADSTVATATVATNVVTLSALQGGESNTDKLQIFYDAVTGDPTYDTPPLANNAAKETGGNLATLAGAVSASKFNTNLSSVSANSTPLNIFPGTTVSTGNTWNSATSLNAVTTIYDSSSTPYELPPAVVVQLDQSSTLTAGAVTFEGWYDNANWLTLPANTILDPTSTSYAQLANPYNLQAGTNKPFLIVNNGWRALRIRLSTAITGTGAITPYITLLAVNPIQQAVVYSPTAANFQVTANAGSNLNTSALALESGGNLASVATNTSNTATNTSNIATNTTNLPNTIGIAGSAIPSKLLQMGGSDGTNARALATDTSGNLITVGSIASGSTDSGNPVKVGGKFNSPAPTFTNGQRGDIQLTSGGNQKMTIYDSTGANSLTRQLDSSADSNGAAAFMMGIINFNEMFNGSTWDRVRIPSTFRTATATASGNTAVWTPTSGKKFRLMRYKIDIPADAAISGGGTDLDITFQDATTDMKLGTTVFIPTTAGTTMAGNYTTGWIELGNGILSAAANNVLNINLSSTLTTSKVRVQVCGTEE